MLNSNTKEPLNEKEQEILLKHAKLLGDFTIGEDNLYHVNAYQTVLLFLDTGMHPSVLSDKRSKLKLTREKDNLYLEWYRPKKKGGDAFTRIRVSKRLMPFIEELIAQPKPNYRQYYNAMLNKIADEIQKSGESSRGLSKSNLSPIALRHTFGVNRLRDGLDIEAIRKLMNCSQKTLSFYLKYRDDDLEKKLDEIGW